MNRSTPERLDDDEFLARLIFEAGEPAVEPRPEHVTRVRALIQERLGRVKPRRQRTRWLVAAGLAAACLLIVLAMRFGWSDRPLPDSRSGPPADPFASRSGNEGTTSPRLDALAWRNAQRGLDVSQLPAFSWPVQEPPTRTLAVSIRNDLFD